jgi:hypothetical protein
VFNRKADQEGGAMFGLGPIELLILGVMAALLVVGVVVLRKIRKK